MSRNSNAVVHCIAECMNCAAQWENYLTARSLARDHHIKTGHRVTGESGTAWSYGELLPPRRGKGGGK